MKNEVVCKNENCENTFVPINGQHLYCSYQCQPSRIKAGKRYENKRIERNKYTHPSVTDGSMGAIHELIVSADLLSRGYHVFRSVSASCPFDLVGVSSSGKMYKIEVKTGWLSDTGQLMFPMKEGNETKYDILAVVLHDRTIIYLDEYSDVLIFSKSEEEPTSVPYQEVIDAGLNHHEEYLKKSKPQSK